MREEETREDQSDARSSGSCCGGSSTTDADCCGDSPTSATDRNSARARIEVFEPAMCCATGVCGPNVDPNLVRFAEDVEWLRDQDVDVQRHSLSQDPKAFAANLTVRDRLTSRGPDCLPIVLVGGEVRWEGAYPTRSALSEILELGDAAAFGILTPQVKALVALSAAFAANCEPCFRFHYDQARTLRVTADDMWATVEIARTVKEAPSASVLQTATRYLRPSNAASKGREAAGTALPVVEARKCC